MAQVDWLYGPGPDSSPGGPFGPTRRRRAEERRHGGEALQRRHCGGRAAAQGPAGQEVPRDEWGGWGGRGASL